MDFDVIVIGAGPAGSVAAAVLARRGWSVTVLEQAHFPRFSIGESLLPQATEWLEASGLQADVERAGFQPKNGAIFRRGNQESIFDFREKTASGWGTTFQVRRDKFDDILARGAARLGAQVAFGQTVVSFRPDSEASRLTVRDKNGSETELSARFVLDASGFGRVLAKLRDLEQPTDFPLRASLFTHVEDAIPADAYDRNKILISVNPDNQNIWYWLIPLAHGQASVGVVGSPDHLAPYGDTVKDRFDALVAGSGLMATLLERANPIREVGEITGYACRVSSLTGPGYALLGNAGEFLDPVFSSGVTIALKSAMLAAEATDRQLKGNTVDWNTEFSEPLSRGVETFRSYVMAWYDGSLQTIIFNPPSGQTEIKRMITSVLAGYAWDEDNPFVREPRKYLELVGALCR